MSDSGSTLSWPPRHRLLIDFVVVAVLLGVGVYAGLRSPWGTKHPQVLEGIAMRANDENDLVMFDADDGTQIDFGADHIWWESENTGGESNPPCLGKPHEKARVEVGYLWIAHPGGGAHQQAVWVRCL